MRPKTGVNAADTPGEGLLRLLKKGGGRMGARTSCRKKKQNREKKSETAQAMRVRVSWLLYFLALGMFALGYFQEFISYFVAVVLHEMAHAEVSRRLGYVLTTFKLTPAGAALIGEFESSGAGDEIKIAVAGPLLNLLLCVLFTAVLWLVPGSYFFTYKFILANLYLAVFNLMPIFPLDGGRVLLAACSVKWPREKAYKRVRFAGIVFSGLLLALFVASAFYTLNLSFLMMSVFILLSTVIPDKNAKYQPVYRLSYRTERIKRGLPVREIMVEADCPVGRLFARLNANCFTRFTVVDRSLNVIAAVPETALEQVSADRRALPVGVVFRDKTDVFSH